jgi:ribonuclease HI
MSSTRIFFDGGCRPNPGMMEVAAVVRGVAHVRPGIGVGSNSDAEWLALLHAVEIARAMKLDDVEFVGDSALVVAQAAGMAKCRAPALRAHLAAFHAATAGIGRVRLRQVKRAKNLAGIALAARHR